MEKNFINFYALGTKSEWFYLKQLSKSQNWKFSFKLMFESEWEEFQQQALGYIDKNLYTISYFNNSLTLGIDEYTSSYPNFQPETSKFLEKFYKTLSPSKKYVEWSIQFENSIEKIVIELDFSICPRTCENFWQISTNHPILSYKNSYFHRTVPNLFIEGGLIESSIHSIYIDYFPDENYNYLHNTSGVIGMSKQENSNNGTCFYITLRPIKCFNGNRVAFGRVVIGMASVQKISESKSANQRILEKIFIKKSKNFFSQQHAISSENKDESFNYRDITNELLKLL